MKDVTVTPLRDRLAVIIMDTDAKLHSPTRLVLSASAIDNVKRGRVVAVGDGWLTPHGELVPLKVKTDDVVLFHGTSGAKMYSYGVEYVVLREGEILAIETQKQVE